MLLKPACRKASVSDGDIQAALRPHSAETSRPCRRVGGCFRTLHSSLRRVFKKSGLNERMAYKQLAKRVRLNNPRLGLCRMQTRTDRCAVCHCWDYVTSVRVKSGIKDVIDGLGAACDGYWSAAPWATDMNKWLKDMGDTVQKASFWRTIIGYIENKPGDRTDFDAETALILETQEDLSVHQLSELAADVSLYQTHWAIRNVIKDALSQDLQHPPANAICMWGDYKEM